MTRPLAALPKRDPDGCRFIPQREPNDSAAIFYGFGWEITTLAVGHRKIFHDGALTGFRAAIARFVDDKLTVVILTNGYSAQPGSMVDVVAALYVPALTMAATK